MNKYMYLGPTIKGVVRHNRILTGEQKAYVSKEAEKVSEFVKYLFAPMDDIVAKKTELKTQGSLMDIAFRKVLNTLQEVENGSL